MPPGFRWRERIGAFGPNGRFLGWQLQGTMCPVACWSAASPATLQRWPHEGLGLHQLIGHPLSRGGVSNTKNMAPPPRVPMRKRFRRAYRRAVPLPIRQFIAELRITRDPRSFVRYMRLKRLSPAPVPVRVRALENREALIRPLTSDAAALRDAFAGLYHLPPSSLPPNATILDLGANIGLTAAHYAVLAPTAHVVAVEMDPGNAALARKNVEPWRDRIEVITAAVWWESGTISYSAPPGHEYGFHIADSGDANTRTCSAITVGELVGTYGRIDFLKMDIEGAEREVLVSAGDWADKVDAIKVETHGHYTADRCARDLEALGFRTTIDDRHWSAVTGVR